MHRVLIVAPSFIPSSYPPTHRVRFFARHLPEFGWEPEVVTVVPSDMGEPADSEIGRLVPPELRITRSRAVPLWLTRRFAMGDLGYRSLLPMRRVLVDIVEKRRPDLVFIPGPPWAAFLQGPYLRKRFGIPFVIDYIDPWVSSMGDDGRWWTKAYWYRQLALKLEPAVVRDASHFVAVSDGTNDEVRDRYPWIPADRFTGIPYGFEASDFDALRSTPRANPFWDAADGNSHLVYVGAMLPKGFETLRALFAALLELRDSAPQLFARLRLHFFGTTYEPNATKGRVVPIAEEMGVRGSVTEHPARVPYLDALNILCSADVILGLGSSERHYTASKIFPNILARRPMLAIYHEASTVCDIVREAHAGELVTYSDDAPAGQHVPEIAAALRRLLTPGTYSPERVRWDHFEEYSARNMSRQLAAIFDGVAGRAENDEPLLEGAVLASHA
jgi:hypothetical protein